LAGSVAYAPPFTVEQIWILACGVGAIWKVHIIPQGPLVEKSLIDLDCIRSQWDQGNQQYFCQVQIPWWELVGSAVVMCLFFGRPMLGCDFFRKYTVRRYALELAGTFIFRCWLLFSDSV
jgi:hypothetical protein